MRKIGLTIILSALLSITFLPNASAHCEVPCGIYGDSLRISLIYEHISTIEKAMNQINTLSKEDNLNYNQIVRWVNNKEKHAEEIQEIVAQYFLHQRVKIKKSTEDGYNLYVKQLRLLHAVQVYAMKAKQGTDLKNISELRKNVHGFEHAYFEKHDH